MRLPVLPTASPAPWYATGLNFTCAECGNCCTGGPGYVWISEEEIDRLAAHLKLVRAEVLERYCRLIGHRYSLKEHRTPEDNYDCIFLREEKVRVKGLPVTRRTCTVYPVRPLQCRTWPFWDGLLSSRESWDRAAKRCPGMNHGRQWSPSEIERLCDASDWPDDARTSVGKARGGR